jgi:hypothetical protein
MKYRAYNNLPAFTIHDLAKISDWLEETGELYVNIYLGTGDVQYFIRSLQDLRLMVLQEPNWSDWETLAYTVFRDVRFSLRGVADAVLLERALQEFPEGHSFYVSTFAYGPHRIKYVATGISHEVLVRAFADEWGHLIAIGSPPPDDFSNLDIETTVEVWPSSTYAPHDHMPMLYEPYLTHPERYQWIVEMWHE